MEETWTYKNFEIKEGLKPGSNMFRYFFRVFEDGRKKCNCCVWIVDDALDRFDPAGNFNAIAASQKASWHGWIREKIDAGDFRDRALKYEKTGETEIDLSEMKTHVKVE
ncbi:hypothetical protein DSCA_63130 [Desulfosarcina alkanivorans]|jgi:hypothetical protein|uniref:Uncharacterized protein n=1 Tax=Desulfosarcina alkanivorans TaxID=571177 RepID=A0A5K7YWM9_9BACT|nr:hypothetical protein [Desulfosarcina alkanivorans]BBO72383.1 hypothetical protein DSCA_63130 [Desulfosarcina alkanivorans]